jgi:hypothetical protein
VHIPKGGDSSQTRAIGVPTFEDKVLQRAVAMVLEAVYEQSFLDCSYGFRLGRSAHQALKATRDQTMRMAGRWVLEIDVRKFFDSLDHRHLRSIVRKRVRDGVLLRLIGKWLKAGVMEDGRIEYPETGSPQGGCISPVLSNIYLHEVLDEWFTRQVAPRLVGRALLVRYCDDAIIIFERERDAQRVLDVLPKRLAKYGLTLHPEKTRLVDFRRPDTKEDALPEDDATRPGTFEPVRLYSLLGEIPQGILGGDAEDGAGPLPARSPARRRPHPKVSARARARAVGRTQAKAGGALWVLRHCRKFPCALRLLVSGQTCVAVLAFSPFTAGPSLVGQNGPPLAALSFAAAAHPFCPSRVAKPCTEEPDAIISPVRIRGSLGERSPRRPDQLLGGARFRSCAPGL